MTIAGLRAALAQGQATLTAAGFAVTSERLLDSSGDMLIELERGLSHIEIGLDRGELDLIMRAPGGGGDYQLALWEACLDDRNPSLEPGDFVADVQLLIRRAAGVRTPCGGASARLGRLPRAGGQAETARETREGTDPGTGGRVTALCGPEPRPGGISAQERAFR
jgi:hypothetical protein